MSEDKKAVHSVPIELSVVLGRTQMPIRQLLKMGRGAVISLQAGVKEHTWIYANGRMIARGEIVVVGDRIGVSITETMT
jgi:flagellar motor switch protein FliN/FliY